jgi:UDP-N-acetyl-D-mannosaminuronate dehydrogenase
MDNFRQAGLDFSLAAMGRSVNDSMAAYALSLVKDRLSEKKALILGLSFRPEVKEDANSTGAALYRILTDEGFDVFMHDAVYTEAEISDKGFRYAAPGDAKVELVFLVTMHKQYHQLDFEKLSLNGVRHIVDGRNALPQDKIKAAGINYIGIGKS